VNIKDLHGQGHPVFSFEFFPPRTDEAAERLMETVAELGSVVSPDFVSVTYGAGGSTRGRTLECVTRIQHELGITAMAHLTCGGHDAGEVASLVDRLVESEITNILALRGDPPQDSEGFVPVDGGFAHASDLMEYLRGRGDVSFGGACYPEAHPESSDGAEDMRWTRHKIDCGAEFLVTQLFFDNAHYFRFVDDARAAGIDVPITPGIMPITNVSQIERFTKMCGAEIGTELHDRLHAHEDDPAAVMAIGIEHAIEQCRGLLEGGAPGIHFYTLNKSLATRSILAAVKQ